METDTLDILSLYQYKGRNSAASFETVQTAGRLLDKLELSAEDEQLLQMALRSEQEEAKVKEEEERQQRQEERRRRQEEEEETTKLEQGLKLEEEQAQQAEQSPTVCMPASGFPSLRNKNLKTPKKDRVMAFSVADPFGQGDKALCTSAEQHQPTKSRYSYFVEEVDSEEDSEDAKQIVSAKPNKAPKPVKRGARTVRAEIYGALNCGVAPLQRQPTTGSTCAPPVVNFEKYRMDTSTLLTKSPSYKKVKLHQNLTNDSSSAEFGRHPSLAKSQHSLMTASEASTPDHSSLRRNHSTATTVRNKDSATNSPMYVFRTNTVSNKSDCESVSSPSRDTPTKEKGKSSQKKKMSFNLKNLFRSSSKNTKRKNSQGSEDAIPPSMVNVANDSVSTSVSTSDTNSAPDVPDTNKSSSHKYIYPKKLGISLESIPSQHELETETGPLGQRATQHLRSLSDHHAMTAKQNVRPQPLACPQLGGRKLSLDSRHNSGPISNFGNPTTRDDDRKFTTVAAGSASHQYSPSMHHRRNNIANLGESARKLHDSCNAGDKEACLLYGMALRHGYGVVQDYNESFRYLFAATGLKSEMHDILEVDIDPVQLERDHQIPELAPEPEAPALYECALSYLKGYGMDHEDEAKGLKYLEKAASLSHLDAMCLSGTIWSRRSSVRKKDLPRAAAWFRIAEKRGAHLIGADWIYKEKYINIANNHQEQAYDRL